MLTQLRNCADRLIQRRHSTREGSGQDGVEIWMVAMEI